MQKLITLLILCFTFSLHAQQRELSIERIFGNWEYTQEWIGQIRWMDDGDAYTTLERSEDYARALQIVKHETASGKTEILVSVNDLLPNGTSQPLYIQNYHWSSDNKKLLIFSNSKRVWRRNTRGDYWMLDMGKKKLTQLGKSLPESSLMFAKFSPDANKVAYVSRNNLYVESLSDQKITQLTTDGSITTINGTFDWAYEEEFDCRDGFRWSPDGKSIAYWQLDATGIRDFLMINNTDSLYPFTIPVQYPKVGTSNSSCKVGVVKLSNQMTTWMKVSNDTRNNYIPRMEWAGNSSELILQQLNRHQNTNNITICQAETGNSTIIYTDKDDTWVKVVDDMILYDNNKKFTWISEKNGWSSAYEISRDGKQERLISPGSFDIVNIELIDTKNGWIYYRASPHNATQRYLFRNKIKGKAKAERLSPTDMPGTHTYNISPNGKWAIHSYSNASTPKSTSLISLPDHKVQRVFIDNKTLKNQLNTLGLNKKEFFQVKNSADISLDGFMIKPPNFDPNKKYPVLFYVYGEPWSQTVLDSWGGSRFFYHQLLAQKGYIVMSIDNRGTPAPKGRTWRKSIYAKLGVISSQDQADAVKAIIKKYPFVDEDRIGIWGWSGGGAMTLNALFRYPEIYKMGISVAPVTDISLYDNIYQERYCGLINEKKQEYHDSSPINFAQNLKGQLLLIHGTGDDNVHYQHSERLINKLVKHNKVFSMLAYPNRSHGIYEGDGTTQHLYESMFQFVLNNL